MYKYQVRQTSRKPVSTNTDHQVIPFWTFLRNKKLSQTTQKLRKFGWATEGRTKKHLGQEASGGSDCFGNVITWST